MSHFHKLLLETRLSFNKADHIFKRPSFTGLHLGRLFIISYSTIDSQRGKKGHTARLGKPPLPLTSESKNRNRDLPVLKFHFVFSVEMNRVCWYFAMTVRNFSG